MGEYRDRLVPVLEEARRLGFLGPGPVGLHLDHAAGFAAAVESAVARSAAAGDLPARWNPARAADLGSGAGVPGLPLALVYDGCAWVLVEASTRRAAFLRSAVQELDLMDRVDVVELRAEEVGRLPAHRGGYDLVVARGFGPPAVVAECAAPLLGQGGRAVVSDPPGGAPSRWPADGLAVLGLEPELNVVDAGPAYQVLRRTHPCPARYPRRVGIPGKRPLFSA